MRGCSPFKFNMADNIPLTWLHVILFYFVVSLPLIFDQIVIYFLFSSSFVLTLHCSYFIGCFSFPWIHNKITWYSDPFPVSFLSLAPEPGEICYFFLALSLGLRSRFWGAFSGWRPVSGGRYTNVWPSGLAVSPGHNDQLGLDFP